MYITAGTLTAGKICTVLQQVGGKYRSRSVARCVYYALCRVKQLNKSGFKTCWHSNSRQHIYSSTLVPTIHKLVLINTGADWQSAGDGPVTNWTVAGDTKDNRDTEGPGEKDPDRDHQGQPGAARGL